MNTIEEEINKIAKSLNERRDSGRTNKVIDEMIEFISQAVPGQKIILFALTQQIANRIQQRFFEKISSTERVKFVGNSIELNGVLVYFKTEHFKNNPSYKYETWDRSYYDNSIDDSHTADHIRFLQREITI